MTHFQLAIAPRGPGKLGADIELKLAIATEGGLTNLEGGFPIIFEGICVGAIGVGSGTGAQDCEVARAALAALEHRSSDANSGSIERSERQLRKAPLPWEQGGDTMDGIVIHGDLP